jgi:NAD(P)-dependent dehydrogenase (short-subunit alcohol dehydrogenase family)
MSDMRFDGRVAIVTGAGRGLGRAHALELASRGAKVVVNDLGVAVDGKGSDTSVAADLVNEIQDLGGEAVADANSVASKEGGAALFKTAMDAFGRVDIVVHNAGLVGRMLFQDMTDEALVNLMDVHLMGAFHVLRPVWPGMVDRKYGRIVVTSSQSGILGNEGANPYGAAKMGLVGMIKVLAVEGRELNIKANAIAPISYTRHIDATSASAVPLQMWEQKPLAAGEKVRAREEVAPERASATVAYLCHEDCAVSGEAFSASARVARFFVGETEGYFQRSGLSAEDVRDHIDQIMDTAKFAVHTRGDDEFVEFRRILGN